MAVLYNISVEEIGIGNVSCIEQVEKSSYRIFKNTVKPFQPSFINRNITVWANSCNAVSIMYVSTKSSL